MREIKFRAWDKKLKQFIKEAHGFHVIGEVTAFDMIQGYCCENKAGANSSLERIGDIEIQQFTGLRDKNGTEIYEGDILESVSEIVHLADNRPTGKIAVKRFFMGFQEEYSRFQLQRISDGRFELLPHSQFLFSHYYSVIGNIYENPELLEVKP